MNFFTRGIVWLLQWISWRSAQLSRWFNGETNPELPPQTRLGPWEQLAVLRHVLTLTIPEAVEVSLDNRKRHGRDQRIDNTTLAPLTDAMFRATEMHDYQFAAELFREGYAKILAYEKLDPPCEVHKGAPAFDVARAYLQNWDFFAAMHYFELAQKETRLTDGNPLFSIYDFNLFAVNFWDAVQVNTSKYPISIYQEFWGKTYDRTTAIEDYTNLSDDVKLAYIIACAERVRLQHIEDHSGWDGSDALRLGYWTLAADLARLLEVEAKRRYKSAAGARAPDGITIVPCLEQGFTNTAFGNISDQMQNTIRSLFPRQPPAGSATPTAADLYELHFDAMLAKIRNPAELKNDRIYTALYLLGFTRNQVAHKIQHSSKLFGQLADAKYLVDLFIALCRTDEWKPL